MPELGRIRSSSPCRPKLAKSYHLSRVYLPCSHNPHLIMSRRTLGGGRVLGTPNALVAAASTPSPQQKPSILSPSASSLSLSSQASVSQFSSETQDLTSRISLENGATSISAAPAASGAQLACPICNEEMVWPTSLTSTLSGFLFGKRVNCVIS